ncbi:YlbG family protein [Schleiferilactobacillus shenzhenensis]|uniref:YlbG n=1 Tax=Schleiferilactobacillus shenzhenensis LY-73 TaxID=1231336 RepID=U4TQM4_9LACO|nr:YlbG family protein [Schleiferilactobacillus shenzhenensis]ERL66514.1 ylbG [Schleiferilactobacillus shenzhenensis LY-73]
MATPEQTIPQPRTGIAVWLYSAKQARKLRRYGLVYYVSERMKYVVLYVDSANAEATVQQLQKQRFVRSVSVSPHGTIATEYAHQLIGERKEDDD